MLIKSLERITALLGVRRRIRLHPGLELSRVLVVHQILTHHIVGLSLGRETKRNDLQLEQVDHRLDKGLTGFTVKI